MSFTANPGDSFYVWAALTVYADSSHQVIGVVDAAHTLAMDFSAGDTSLLQASIRAVPQPSTSGSIASGLALLGLIAWRRRGSNCASAR